MQLKIIDKTLNDMESSGSVFRYCSVLLFGDIEDLYSLKIAIGSIVFLDKFSFNNWEKLMLQTRFTNSL